MIPCCARTARGCALAVVTSLFHPAYAAEVTVSGGFVSYLGPTWDKVYPSIVVSTRIETSAGLVVPVPLQQPLPADPEDLFHNAGIGLGSASLTAGGLLPAAQGIEFWQSFDGSKDGVNAIAFAPAPATTVVVGEEFMFGTLSLTNGGWFGSIPLAGGGSYVYPESAFGFVLTTHSADAALDGHQFTGTVRFHVTATASSDPALDADYFYILERPDLGYVGAFESYNTPSGSNTGTIALWGRIGSLVPTRFDDPEGVVLAASLPAEPVPLPAALVLALAPLTLLARRRRGVGSVVA